MTQLFTADFNETIVGAMYNAYLAQLVDEEWATHKANDLFRQDLIAYNNHNLAVTMDFVTNQAITAFKFIKGNEGDKDIKVLYTARLALIDMIEALIAKDTDVAIINGLLQAMQEQVRHEIVGGITADATYDLAEADQIMNDYWYFLTDGALGTATENLFYGQNQLVWNGQVTEPETLATTDIYGKEQAADALNALLDNN